MRRIVSLSLALAFILALVVFAVVNRQTVFLSFPGLAVEIGLPAWALVFAGVFVGLLLAGLSGLWPFVRRTMERRLLLRRAERAEARLARREAEEPATVAASLAAIDRAQEAGRRHP